ncbi:MAG: large conductance mechanosensitive channel protein MscL [Firmicutes bacterium]|jgi:large conductance mechanosensitive channel|nr:large conductance mechanosensitive channel protein MscL [Bacillota bacterium]MCR4710620.1 large conductance mechanosensitive channel protein MscL [Clostridiales bacterium]
MKKFMTEFKEFIAKGNVMTMAVGIIIGGAFTAIINSVVADIISPIIGLILGGVDFSKVSFGIGDAQIMIGNLINAIITFLITAIVLFFIIKAFNKWEESKKKEEEPAPEEEPAVPEDIQLLSEIRDLLKK